PYTTLFRSYAKIVDEVNKRPLSTFQRQEEPQPTAAQPPAPIARKQQLLLGASDGIVGVQRAVRQLQEFQYAEDDDRCPRACCGCGCGGRPRPHHAGGDLTVECRRAAHDTARRTIRPARRRAPRMAPATRRTGVWHDRRQTPSPVRRVT